MSLDKDAFSSARIAYWQDGGDFDQKLTAAIETYLEEMFKPGQLVMGEAIQPARDYRKELWIAAIQNAGSSGADYANAALAEFDKTFPKDPS